MVITEFLERNGRRMVPDREIPLAIAYSSVSRMCNAVRDTFSSGPIAAPLLPISISQSTIIEDNTQPREPRTLVRKLFTNMTRSIQNCQIPEIFMDLG